VLLCVHQLTIGVMLQLDCAFAFVYSGLGVLGVFMCVLCVGKSVGYRCLHGLVCMADQPYC
jgi:hypothetical protein